jgi:hypothetical protein
MTIFWVISEFNSYMLRETLMLIIENWMQKSNELL